MVLSCKVPIVVKGKLTCVTKSYFCCHVHGALIGDGCRMILFSSRFVANSFLLQTGLVCVCDFV